MLNQKPSATTNSADKKKADEEEDGAIIATNEEDLKEVVEYENCSCSWSMKTAAAIEAEEVLAEDNAKDAFGLNLMDTPLEVILKEVEEAEERWAKLLQQQSNAKKPEILSIGPKPLKLKKKQEEPKYPIFPLPNTNKSRGGILARTKKDLNKEDEEEDGAAIATNEEDLKEVVEYENCSCRCSMKTAAAIEIEIEEVLAEDNAKDAFGLRGPLTKEYKLTLSHGVPTVHPNALIYGIKDPPGPLTSTFEEYLRRQARSTLLGFLEHHNHFSII
ncbi:hypothetical protein FF38_07138 [Lucilia cuprina]|uniref:Uncharacterized protein n=1 Tax=Lucilia cuprina TaxID=7375 RepID=A0A0L0CGP9_LUCCU|nr:hypothetical protein FF38_07138 [Lucilia cuprina]